MEKFHTLLSPTSLLVCEENGASLCEEMDDDFASILQIGDYDDDDHEYTQMLFDREIVNGGIKMYEFSQTCGADWTQKRARLDGIDYILRKRDLLGFGFQTAYLSVTYFDRFLARRSIDAEKGWAIRLLSMACLSLAAKMEECEVPILSEFCSADYNFESRMIQKMEFLVLNTLEWKMGSITPFAFTRFFAKKLCENSPPRNVLADIAQVILDATRDVKIMSHRPSVIAAAATLFVIMDKTITSNDLEIKISPLSSTYALKIEDVISCYYQVQEMEIERLRSNVGIKSPDLSPIQLQRTEAYNGSSSVTSISSAKRKRLVFNQSNQYGDDTFDKKQKST